MRFFTSAWAQMHGLQRRSDTENTLVHTYNVHVCLCGWCICERL